MHFKCKDSTYVVHFKCKDCPYYVVHLKLRGCPYIKLLPICFIKNCLGKCFSFLQKLHHLYHGFAPFNKSLIIIIAGEDYTEDETPQGEGN